MMPFATGIVKKSGITYVFSHNYAKIKIDSYDSLPLEKALTLHNVIILIKSVLKKNQNHYYYYIIFLEKCSYQLAKIYKQNFLDSILMLRFSETKVAKKELYGAKRANKNFGC